MYRKIHNYIKCIICRRINSGTMHACVTGDGVCDPCISAELGYGRRGAQWWECTDFSWIEVLYDYVAYLFGREQLQPCWKWLWAAW